jgi:hypothetical protein
MVTRYFPLSTLLLITVTKYLRKQLRGGTIFWVMFSVCGHLMLLPGPCVVRQSTIALLGSRDREEGSRDKVHP